MTVVQKAYPVASFKALPEEGEGTFEAVVSVFGNVDLQGDRVMPGAFGKSIAKWQKSGDVVPVLWSHSWGDPFAHIGYVRPQDMKEVRGNQKSGFPGGLYVKGHLDVHKPFAKQVYDLLAERRVREYSFSYDIPSGGERRGKDGANELVEVDIIEVGPTLKGANPETVHLGTKSADDLKFRLENAAEKELAVQTELAKDRELFTELSKAEWNGDAAMKSCHSAADFRKIAFERDNDSDPDTAAHWALPHHSSPGAEANPAGVSAALGALSGARGGAPDLKDRVESVRSHLESHQNNAKFDPGQQRDETGEWSAGGGGNRKPQGGNRSGEDDKEKWPKGHPLGEGTLKTLRSTLKEAGMKPEAVEKLAQDMRDHFHETGKINIPKEADKFLSADQREKLANEIRTEARKRGWEPPKSIEDFGVKRDGGNVENLLDWYRAGADGQIPWGSPGDFDACVAVASRHMDPEDAKGFCQNRHQEVTGHNAGDHGKAFRGKPWHVEKDGDQWCIIKDADGSQVACHDTEEQAQAQLRALYANEKTVHEDAGFGAKAGRTISATAAQQIKDHVMAALDECFGMLNGGETEGGYEEKLHDAFGEKLTGAFEEATKMEKIVLDGHEMTEAEARERLGLPPKSSPPPMPVGSDADLREAIEEAAVLPEREEPVQTDDDLERAKKSYARGYADASAGRKGPEITDAEYRRGYEEGRKDRATVDHHEIESLEAQLAAIEIRTA